MLKLKILGSGLALFYLFFVRQEGSIDKEGYLENLHKVQKGYYKPNNR